jgi:hypothetical protein
MALLFASKNRFNDFREDFHKDTNLSPEANIEAYISYVNARFADQNNKLLTDLAKDIQELNKTLKKV